LDTCRGTGARETGGFRGGTSAALPAAMRKALLNVLPALAAAAPSLFAVALFALALFALALESVLRANEISGFGRARIPSAGRP